ncbi:twin transmembrane helix small protein [Denitromonas halophila]|uniref:Twin transmembrane helix small protein n=1 Tax=Denitromonas halophila TaxID=1629404 RepID=A0A557QST4_9RHOO|nr:twin transmembrane helix small protein [Denitromonas halophila]TVO55975.1 twin transmembrane helix small protein [Denitromonas halophila]
MRIVVVLFLIAILVSLGSALLFMLRDDGKGPRVIRALTLRVGLSIGLFLLLMAGFATGIIPGRL